MARRSWWKAATVSSRGEDRLVAAVGVNDLVIVDTGDAVLVADRDRAQDVKEVVSQLSDLKDEAAEFHKTVYRPWGSFSILEDAEDCKVKRLVVKPGQVLVAADAPQAGSSTGPSSRAWQKSPG